MSVRLFVWAVPRRFFQSLLVPCGVFCEVGEGRAWWNTGLGEGERAGKDRAGGGGVGGQHGRGGARRVHYAPGSH
jgi:hypothetical protein